MDINDDKELILISPITFRNEKFDADFSQEYISLRRSNTKVNFKIIRNKKEFSVHKNLLIKRCPYFASMLEKKFYVNSTSTLKNSSLFSVSINWLVGRHFLGDDGGSCFIFKIPS